MSDPTPFEATSQSVSRPRDRLVEHYREIGISAVVAAFCIMSEPVVAKDATTAKGGSPIQLYAGFTD